MAWDVQNTMHAVTIIKGIVADNRNGVAYNQISIETITSKECAGLNSDNRIWNHQIASETRAVGKCTFFDGGHGIRNGQACQVETIQKCAVADGCHSVVLPVITHRFGNDQRSGGFVAIDMSCNRYGNAVIVHTIVQITGCEFRRLSAVSHEQAGRIINVASIMESTQHGVGSGVGIKLIHIAIMNAKQFARQHVKSHLYRQINRANYSQLCIGKIQ